MPQFSIVRFSRPLLALALTTTFAATAFAQASSDIERPRTAAEELAAAQVHAKQLAERAGLNAIDSTAPVLSSFNITGTINAQTPNPTAELSIKLKDNLSGIVYYSFQLRSPSGRHYVYRSKSLPAPNTNVNATVTFGAVPFSNPGFTKFAEPGVWVANSFYAYDANGNAVSYGESQLDALGTHTLTVVNTGGYDNVSPVFEQATILTPTVKLSKPPAGTGAGTRPYVSADLSITDAGNGLVSGVYYATLYMCRTDAGGSCIDFMYLSGTVNRGAQTANTLRVGTQLAADQVTGSYRPYYIYLEDAAGNYTYHYDVDFGGDLDLSDFFTSGSTIFVNS